MINTLIWREAPLRISKEVKRTAARWACVSSELRSLKLSNPKTQIGTIKGLLNTRLELNWGHMEVIHMSREYFRKDTDDTSLCTPDF